MRGGRRVGAHIGASREIGEPAQQYAHCDYGDDSHELLPKRFIESKITFVTLRSEATKTPSLLSNEGFFASLSMTTESGWFYARWLLVTRIARSTRSGVNGASRRRAPVASKMALPMAAGTGPIDGSPPPSAGISGRSIKKISICGI